MKPIETKDDIETGLAALLALDARLAAVVAFAGDVPLRRNPPGLSSFIAIVVSQQISRASADAILARFNALVNPMTAEALLACDDALFREAGLSRPKQQTVRAVAQAVTEGLDLEALCQADPDEAMAELTAIRGVGPWTAEVYLMFAAGHPDIFPAHDVALQAAVAHAFRLDPRPRPRQLYAMAESWAPWRGVAARLFWSYYRQMRGRDVLL